MNFFKRWFSTDRKFIGDYIETGEGLIELTHSNKIAAAEFEDFNKRIEGMEIEVIIDEATVSAKALSGYGISVSTKAFIDTVEK